MYQQELQYAFLDYSDYSQLGDNNFFPSSKVSDNNREHQGPLPSLNLRSRCSDLSPEHANEAAGLLKWVLFRFPAVSMFIFRLIQDLLLAI